MSSRRKSRRRHRKVERWLARGRHPATAVAPTITITITTLVPLLWGRGCLNASAQGYRLPRPAGRPPNPRRPAPEPRGWPVQSLMEAGSPQASPDRAWATIWWREQFGAYKVYATFWATEEIAETQKPPGDPTAIVVNVSKKAKKGATIESVRLQASRRRICSS